MISVDRVKRENGYNNPYASAWKLVAHRLSWDLNPESWRSRKRLSAWKNRFPGAKAVILCNGPSLLKTDLKSLDGTFTFGLNKINLLFKKSDFRPSCIVSVNRLVIEQNAEFFSNTQIPLFIDRYAVNHVQKNENIAFLHSENRIRKFARDCSFSIYHGTTVTFVAMQLAFHMGFRQVALVGCDHNFVTKGPAHQTVKSGASDPNHFDPCYFSGGDLWNLPDLAGSEADYGLAKQVFEAYDGQIVNATVGGKLEIYQRMALDEFLACSEQT